MSAHTPTPWRVLENTRGLIVPADGDGSHRVASTVDRVAYERDPDNYHDDNAARDEANAARIVKCVNAHDELVEALKTALADLDRLAAVGRCSGMMQGAVAARAALAKVTA